MVEFQPHGGTAVELHGRVLVFRSHTNVNREEVGRLQQETVLRLRGLAGTRWAVLGVVDVPVLLTADAEVAAGLALREMAAQGLVGLAVAFVDRADRVLLEAQAERIVGGAIPLKSVDEPADAEAWLNALIGAE